MRPLHPSRRRPFRSLGRSEQGGVRPAPVKAAAAWPHSLPAVTAVAPTETGPLVGDELVLVGHGSRDPAQGEVLRALRDAIAAELSARRVVLAWIELDTPLVSDVMAQLADPGNPPVVVPLLLSRGTHV